MEMDDDAPRGGIRPHLDAKQCELLISLACKSEKPPRPAAATPGAAPGTRTRRDSLTEAMIGLILGPDAF
jgi:hypothetical protein